MAKILLGATIGDARGSVGGVTYTKGRFGAVLRQKVSPVQPRSARALTVRGLFGLLSKRWFAELSEAQRVGWIALAAANPRTNVFGNQVILTGLQMYQSCNRNIQLCGEATIDDPPVNLDVTGLITMSIAPDSVAPAFPVTWTPDPLPADHKMIMDATMQVNAGRVFVSSFYRYCTLKGAGPPGVDIITAYTALFGALRQGQRIMVRAFLIDYTKGSASTPLVDTAIVT